MRKILWTIIPRNPIVTFGCLLLLNACSVNKARVAGKPDRPNIIFIMSDDHAYQCVSAYGSQLIQTPHIDRIASEGVLMRNAFVTNALCGPSRAVILTGKYSHLNGFKGNNDIFDGSQPTLPKILKANGYSTAVVGKWHLKSEPTGFDYWNILPGQGNYYNPGFINMGRDTVYKGYVTDITTNLALDWIGSQKAESKPFFLMLHQKAPHRNQMPPLENLGLYNDRVFTPPSSFFDEPKNQQALKRQKNSMLEDLYFDYDNKVPCDTCRSKRRGGWNPKSYERELNRLTKNERETWDQAYREEIISYAALKTREEKIRWQYQRYMEDYLRCVKSVDDNVGRLLQYLDDNGLSENTIIVYTSDQGAFLGEHGLFDKRFMYNESFRTPMMIRYPGKIGAGLKIDQMTMNLDIPPTLLDWAGVTVPVDMQGVSMAKLLGKKGVQAWRDRVYYHYYDKAFGLTAHYGMSTGRYKLIHFYDPGDHWELYDLEKDPQETSNLYSDPAYASLVPTLKKELAELRIKYKEETAGNN